jgi:hypothetical protein
MKVSIDVDIVHYESRIENLMNLRHPCISGTIGIIHPSPLRGLQMFECIVLVVHYRKLFQVHQNGGLGLFHDHLTGNHIFFGEDGMIQICDFCVKSLSEIGGNSEATEAVGGFSGES